jgi:hypothetical protein
VITSLAELIAAPELLPSERAWLQRHFQALQAFEDNLIVILQSAYYYAETLGLERGTPAFLAAMARWLWPDDDGGGESLRAAARRSALLGF